MKKKIKTEEAYIEVSDTRLGNIMLNIYSRFDPDMFVEIFLTPREYDRLYKMLGEFPKEE